MRGRRLCCQTRQALACMALLQRKQGLNKTLWECSEFTCTLAWALTHCKPKQDTFRLACSSKETSGFVDADEPEQGPAPYACPI